MNVSIPMAIARNLSYVLHESSTSPTVQRYATDLQRENVRLKRAIARLDKMVDAELHERIVVEPSGQPRSSHATAKVQILSVKVGAWRLLPRVLLVSRLIPARVQTHVHFLDQDPCGCTQALSFFRGPAQLCAPVSAPTDPGTWIFAAAALRPGGMSILVRFDQVNVDSDSNGSAYKSWQPVLPLAEKTIREFVLQWDCKHPLWDRPAEETLPEFKQKVNGTTECGR